LGTLIGAPVGIALIAGVAVPAILIGLPIWSGRKVYVRYKTIGRHKRNLIVVGTVLGTIVVAPLVAALAVIIGVPILLAYVYGVVPISLCRSGGCGLTTAAGGVRLAFDDDVTNDSASYFTGLANNISNNFSNSETKKANEFKYSKTRVKHSKNFKTKTNNAVTIPISAIESTRPESIIVSACANNKGESANAASLTVQNAQSTDSNLQTPILVTITMANKGNAVPSNITSSSSSTKRGNKSSKKNSTIMTTNTTTSASATITSSNSHPRRSSSSSASITHRKKAGKNCKNSKNNNNTDVTDYTSLNNYKNVHYINNTNSSQNTNTAASVICGSMENKASFSGDKLNNIKRIGSSSNCSNQETTTNLADDETGTAINLLTMKQLISDGASTTTTSPNAASNRQVDENLSKKSKKLTTNYSIGGGGGSKATHASQKNPSIGEISIGQSIGAFTTSFSASGSNLFNADLNSMQNNFYLSSDHQLSLNREVSIGSGSKEAKILKSISKLNADKEENFSGQKEDANNLRMREQNLKNKESLDSDIVTDLKSNYTLNSCNERNFNSVNVQTNDSVSMLSERSINPSVSALAGSIKDNQSISNLSSKSIVGS
jgi:hypothetical protein